MSPTEIAKVCVDLKRRIGGDFYLISASEEELVFGNRRCPFGAAVKDRPSLCMMTSNVFGRITADNLGYARVDLEETIAQGDPGCRVVVRLNKDNKGEVHEREYYRAFDPDLADEL
ncbi:methanogen output domain 1-containing protein [Maritalea mediterranea]|uniref:Methanogen output domain 1-containing protein n=1 Tax=Maritalea mediterranea TaxID=2909667 RepID=A0ABS9E3Y2_9HYPH|nr:methanogen output domain 1-containing protein [Maritalea mediterranea]MCF4097583.1 methanogen output domain 1-containing protein [Maritalea mediterranea]